MPDSNDTPLTPDVFAARVRTLADSTRYSGRMHLEMALEENFFVAGPATPPPVVVAEPADSTCLRLASPGTPAGAGKQFSACGVDWDSRRSNSGANPNTPSDRLPSDISRLAVTFWVRPDAPGAQSFITLGFGSGNLGTSVTGLRFGVTADGVPEFSLQSGSHDPSRPPPQVGSVWKALAPKRWHRVVLEVRWDVPANPSPKTAPKLDARCSLNGEREPVLEAHFDLGGDNGQNWFSGAFEGLTLGSVTAQAFGSGSRTNVNASFSDLRVYTAWPTTPDNETDDLLLHWPLHRPEVPANATGPNAFQILEAARKNVADVSGRRRHGELLENNRSQNSADPYVGLTSRGSSAPVSAAVPVSPATSVNPPPAALAPARLDAIVKAVGAARQTGEFPEDLFPYVTPARDDHARTMIKRELAKISDDQVRDRYREGYALAILEAALSCCPRVDFVPVARVARRPRLLVVLDARMSNFAGRCGGGRLVHTMSLFPGESTTIAIRTFRKTESESSRASSIFDSFNTTSAQDFERSLQQEQETSRQEDSSQSYYAKVQAEANWGWGNASIEGSGQWDMSSSLSQLTKSLTNATSKHAATASTNREVRVESAERLLRTDEKTESIERQLKNLNVSRTLNFLFWQLNQEFVSLLHVVDVRVAYFDGTAESVREVPLARLEELLAAVIKPDVRNQARTLVHQQLRALKDHTGATFDGLLFKLPATDGLAEPPAGLRGTVSKHQARDGGPEFTVDGVILAADRHVLRTDNVYVDTFLGLGNALDDYSQKLQDETNRTRALENEQLESEVERRRLGSEIVRSGDSAKANVFALVQGEPEKTT